ncbi:MAG TPA: hypothetical protein VL442_14875 [Mucilaginibacter sp.]|jgi:hypothetical protein|nr:hypothetical protein [Mucilaginibacter sp.]
MTKEAIIEKTLKTLNVLPTEKAEEIADFADFVLKKHEEHILQKGIYKIVEGSDTFNFLNEEEVLYSKKDIKGKY